MYIPAVVGFSSLLDIPLASLVGGAVSYVNILVRLAEIYMYILKIHPGVFYFTEE